ncbi:hypothetical protein [Pseudomonas migulae]|uniref:Uncharacterized protein n=1 Tax=Pseudomonas migulae TaxID=78543 RepID=A0ABY8MMG8_9PSED|nr:hypothetical protein [Pseudomonas migulae]WGK88334.1 hypothetical protein MOQ58_17530 [Pseudomonas migulae]
MTSVPLEVSVAEFVKGIDDIFERQLKLLDELRESFRLIAIAMQQSSHEEELPPLEELGVNHSYFKSEVSKSDACAKKPAESSRSTLTLTLSNSNRS